MTKTQDYIIILLFKTNLITNDKTNVCEKKGMNDKRTKPKSTEMRTNNYNTDENRK